MENKCLVLKAYHSVLTLPKEEKENRDLSGLKSLSGTLDPDAVASRAEFFMQETLLKLLPFILRKHDFPEVAKFYEAILRKDWLAQLKDESVLSTTSRTIRTSAPRLALANTWNALSSLRFQDYENVEFNAGFVAVADDEALPLAITIFNEATEING